MSQSPSYVVINKYFTLEGYKRYILDMLIRDNILDEDTPCWDCGCADCYDDNCDGQNPDAEGW